ncbi:MAG TPA: hypothetical protein VF433_12005 [Cellvibrio sp.]
MGERIQIDVRACFINPDTGDVVETSAPDPALTPNLFGVYTRSANSNDDWAWVADFAAYEFLDLFIDALMLKHHNDGSGFDLDLRHIAQFIHR